MDTSSRHDRIRSRNYLVARATVTRGCTEAPRSDGTEVLAEECTEAPVLGDTWCPAKHGGTEASAEEGMRTPESGGTEATKSEGTEA